MNFWTVLSDLAARQPDTEAILAPGRSSLRFGEVPAALEGVRDTLNRYGVGRGDLVVAALPNGAETAVCYLGVVSCAILVPLNPDYAEDEFARYLERVHPKAIILPAGAGTGVRRPAAEYGIPVIDLVVDVAGAAGTFALQSDSRGDPGALGWNGADEHSLILVTSGSTGKPKLVPLRQRYLLGFADAMKEQYRLGPADRCVHVMPMFHGHGLQASLFSPLAAGGGVVCPDRFSVSSFFSHLQNFRPTWYTAGYTIHHTILDHIGPYRHVAKATGLRFLRSGSGRLDPRVMRGLEEAFGVPVLERYGMSEAASLTYNPLPPAVRKPGTVGILGPNEVRIIDEHGAFPGPHRDGEVVARGPLVFDGYWDDPEATAAAFVNGWFRTGDLGRFDDDGYLTICGRIKDLINRGGEKIAPAEVEGVLSEHPAVRDACVFAIPHPTLGEEVSAAVVLVPGGQATEHDIVSHARDRLVPFKVPRRVHFCASLPKGATGKVHRPTVAQMCLAARARTPSSPDAASPRDPSPVEAVILEMWNSTLSGKSAPTRDLGQDFFLAGGDSLSAAELYARINWHFGVVLGLRQVFEDGATVAGIARLVERARRVPRPEDGLPPRLTPIKPDGHRPPLFAVPGSGGNAVGFVHLGRLLDRNQPLYGIESRGLDGAEEPIDQMEEIAAANIRSIKAVQPEGPFYLTGACFGGRVAYEMARQLEEAGDRVGLLIMLDPSPPFTDGVGRPRGEAPAPGRSRIWSRVTLARDMLLRNGRDLVRLRGAARQAYVRDRLRVAWAVAGDLMARRDPFRRFRGGLYHTAVYEANRRAGSRYIPGPFSGPTILCITRDRPVRGERDYRPDWMRLVPQCGGPIAVSGCDSGDMLNLPHVVELASRVNAWMDSAIRSDREESA
jgi:acyl-CoA synthetase (AMP-forming)/AMP-acid ligase II